MAKNSDNLFTYGNRGAVGKQVVFKQINGKTFATKYPNMSGVTYNKTQKKYQNVFADAVKYAKSIIEDPEKLREYYKKIHNDKRNRGSSVYSYAIKEYMKQHSQKVPKHDVINLLHEIKLKFTLTERQTKGIKQLIAQGQLNNSTYQRLASVSKATATRDLNELVKMGLIALTSKGAGAVYTLIGFTVSGRDDT